MYCAHAVEDLENDFSSKLMQPFLCSIRALVQSLLCPIVTAAVSTAPPMMWKRVSSKLRIASFLSNMPFSSSHIVFSSTSAIMGLARSSDDAIASACVDTLTALQRSLALTGKRVHRCAVVALGQGIIVEAHG